MTRGTGIMLLRVTWGNRLLGGCSLRAVMAGATVTRQGNCRAVICACMAAEVLTVTGYTAIRICVTCCQVRQGAGGVMTGRTGIMLRVVQWGNRLLGGGSLRAVMAGATAAIKGNCRAVICVCMAAKVLTVTGYTVIRI